MKTWQGHRRGLLLLAGYKKVKSRTFVRKEKLYFFFNCRKVLARPSPILLKGRLKLCDRPTWTWGTSWLASLTSPSATLAMCHHHYLNNHNFWPELHCHQRAPWFHISQTNGCPALAQTFKNWKVVQRLFLLLLHLLDHHLLLDLPPLHPLLLLCAGHPLCHCPLIRSYDANLEREK